MCSFGDKSFEDEAIGDVELLGGARAAPWASAVDVRDVYVTQAYWAWQNAPEASKAGRFWHVARSRLTASLDEK